MRLRPFFPAPVQGLLQEGRASEGSPGLRARRLSLFAGSSSVLPSLPQKAALLDALRPRDRLRLLGKVHSLCFTGHPCPLPSRSCAWTPSRAGLCHGCCLTTGRRQEKPSACLEASEKTLFGRCVSSWWRTGAGAGRKPALNTRCWTRAWTCWRTGRAASPPSRTSRRSSSCRHASHSRTPGLPELAHRAGSQTIIGLALPGSRGAMDVSLKAGKTSGCMRALKGLWMCLSRLTEERLHACALRSTCAMRSWAMHRTTWRRACCACATASPRRTASRLWRRPWSAQASSCCGTPVRGQPHKCPKKVGMGLAHRCMLQVAMTSWALSMRHER